MTATASEPEDQLVADRSVGYMRPDGTGWQPNTDTLSFEDIRDNWLDSDGEGFVFLADGQIRRGRPRTAALRQKSVRVLSDGAFVRQGCFDGDGLLLLCQS